MKNIDEEEIEKVFFDADADGSGKLDYTEFVQVIMDKEKSFQKENLRKAFGMLDTDNSGSIKITEILEGVK